MARAGAGSGSSGYGGAGPSRRAATIGDSEGSSGGGWRIQGACVTVWARGDGGCVSEYECARAYARMFVCQCAGGACGSASARVRASAWACVSAPRVPLARVSTAQLSAWLTIRVTVWLPARGPPAIAKVARSLIEPVCRRLSRPRASAPAGRTRRSGPHASHRRQRRRKRRRLKVQPRLRRRQHAERLAAWRAGGVDGTGAGLHGGGSTGCRQSRLRRSG